MMLRWPLGIVGAVTVVALILVGAFELIDASARHTFDVRTSYAGVRGLQVYGGGGDVHVIGGQPPGSGVVVFAHVTEGLSTPRRQAVRRAGGVLHLSSSCATGLDTNCDVSYTVEVPSGVSVNAQSGSGNVDARNVTSTAPLKLSSGNGDVHADGIQAPTIVLQSANGDVTGVVDKAAAQLTASSGNGDVSLTVPDVSYAVRASSGNGSVSDGNLRIDPSSPRRIDADSGNGDVTISVPR